MASAPRSIGRDARRGSRLLRPEEVLDDLLEHVRDRPFNEQRYLVDRTKLLSLGWRQQVHLEEGLRLTVQCAVDSDRN